MTDPALLSDQPHRYRPRLAASAEAGPGDRAIHAGGHAVGPAARPRPAPARSDRIATPHDLRSSPAEEMAQLVVQVMRTA